MKWNFKRDIFALGMIVISVLAAAYFYPKLPAIVPSHFNGDGMPNGYSSKQSFTMLAVCLPVLIYLLLTFLPYIDPFKKKLEKNYNVFLILRDIAVLFIVFIMLLTFISAQSGRLRSDLLGAGMGLLFILMGNYLPKLPRNFFFGIRSPWTLASEVVWYRTHRLSGKLFVLAGLLLIILAVVKVSFSISLFAVLIPLALYTAFIYPYFLFRKLEKEAAPGKPDL